MTPDPQSQPESHGSATSTLNGQERIRTTTTNTTTMKYPLQTSSPSSPQPPSPKSADFVNMAQIAERELEEMHTLSSLQDTTTSNTTSTSTNNSTTIAAAAAAATGHVRFPAACRAILLEMEGNSRCLDCGAKNPEWAAVSYGAMVCLQCAGSHRSLGVTVSTVRSVTMDHWRYEEVIKMLEGGNRQLSSFFQRHALGRECSEFQSPHLTSENVSSMRYKTKAALFYRQQLDHHVHHLLSRGPYKGRRRTKRRPLGTQTSALEN